MNARNWTYFFALIAVLAGCAPARRRAPRGPNIGSMPPAMEMRDLEEQRPMNYNPPSHRRLDPEREDDPKEPVFIK